MTMTRFTVRIVLDQHDHPAILATVNAVRELLERAHAEPGHMRWGTLHVYAEHADIEPTRAVLVARIDVEKEHVTHT